MKECEKVEITGKKYAERRLSSCFTCYINRRITELDITQRQLAKEIGVDAGYICKLLKGDRDNPTVSIFIGLAKALKTDVHELMDIATCL